MGDSDYTGSSSDCSESSRKQRSTRIGPVSKKQKSSNVDVNNNLELTHIEKDGIQSKYLGPYVPWTKEEDTRLRELVEQCGAKNWSKIAEHMPTRTSKSCRLRWLNQLRPNVQTGGFTAEEDERIIKAQAELGNKWTTIAAMLPGRTDNAVKNRWNSALRKRTEMHHGEVLQSSHGGRPSSSTRRHSVAHSTGSSYKGTDLAALASSNRPSHPHGPGLDTSGTASTSFSASQLLSYEQLLGFSGRPVHPEPDPARPVWNTPVSGGFPPHPTPTHYRHQTALPATSTAWVATSPPFHLPLPLMSLQPQMNATEAAAVLAATHCDVIKKVSDAHPLVHSITVTSTAMLAATPPPIALSTTHPHRADVQNSNQLPLEALPQLPQHSALVHQLMKTQLAARCLQQQQQQHDSSRTAVSLAMVSQTPSPAVMTLPAASSKAAPSTAASSMPAVSWHLDSSSLDLMTAIISPKQQPTTQPVNNHDAIMKVEEVSSGTSDPMLGQKVGPLNCNKDSAQAVGSLQQSSGNGHSPVPAADVQIAQAAGVEGTSGKLEMPDLAKLLMLQQQQMMQQQAMLQQLAAQLQSQQKQDPLLPSGAPQAAASCAAPFPACAYKEPLAALDGSSSSIQAATGCLAPELVNTPTGCHAPELFNTPTARNDMHSALQSLLAQGGSEALHHLLNLGMGTLMAAASLRQQGHGGGSGTLAAAQLHVAAQPSTQNILTKLFNSQPQHSQLTEVQPRREYTGLCCSGSGGGLLVEDGGREVGIPSSAIHLSGPHDAAPGGPFGLFGPCMDTSFGSMSDLMGLLGCSGSSPERGVAADSCSPRGVVAADSCSPRGMYQVHQSHPEGGGGMDLHGCEVPEGGGDMDLHGCEVPELQSLLGSESNLLVMPRSSVGCLSRMQSVQNLQGLMHL